MSARIEVTSARSEILTSSTSAIERGNVAGDHDAAGEDAIEKVDDRYVRMRIVGGQFSGGERRHGQATGPSANE
jgi:hypothetical protein